MFKINRPLFYFTLFLLFSFKTAVAGHNLCEDSSTACKNIACDHIAKGPWVDSCRCNLQNLQEVGKNLTFVFNIACNKYDGGTVEHSSCTFHVKTKKGKQLSPLVKGEIVNVHGFPMKKEKFDDTNFKSCANSEIALNSGDILWFCGGGNDWIKDYFTNPEIYLCQGGKMLDKSYFSRPSRCEAEEC